MTLGESRFLSELLEPPGEDAGNNTLPGGCREGSELTVGEHLRFLGGGSAFSPRSANQVYQLALSAGTSGPGTEKMQTRGQRQTQGLPPPWLLLGTEKQLGEEHRFQCFGCRASVLGREIEKLRPRTRRHKPIPRWRPLTSWGYRPTVAGHRVARPGLSSAPTPVASK